MGKNTVMHWAISLPCDLHENADIGQSHKKFPHTFEKTLNTTHHSLPHKVVEALATTIQHYQNKDGLPYCTIHTDKIVLTAADESFNPTDIKDKDKLIDEIVSKLQYTIKK